MNTRLRQDALLRVLRRAGSSTVADLAMEVGVSRRTILRDIASLRDQGFVLHSESGPGGGVQLDAQSMQSTARLSVTEVFALLISVAAMRAARVLPFATHADAGLAKIERSLPPEKVRDLRRMLDCLFVGQLSPLQDLSEMGEIDTALLPAFEAAFLQRLCLQFRYRDAKGAVSLRQVEPQAMLILPPLWYLVGWDPGRNGFRHFRMDRIAEPRIVETARFLRRHVPFDQDVCPYSQLPHVAQAS
jgi:predicted DNA-binding transcriptional regulator YafY